MWVSSSHTLCCNDFLCVKLSDRIVSWYDMYMHMFGFKSRNNHHEINNTVISSLTSKVLLSQWALLSPVQEGREFIHTGMTSQKQDTYLPIGMNLALQCNENKINHHETCVII